MPARRHLAARLLVVAAGLCVLGSGCGELTVLDATPVPGAAATAARSAATAMPTPDRPIVAQRALPTPSPARPAARPAASPAPAASPSAVPGVTDEHIAELRTRLQQVFASPDLPGIEDLLYDRVAVASSQGGMTLDRQAAAAWLVERASPDLRVQEIDRNALAVALSIHTEGWTPKPPVQEGRMTFNLHRFDPSGNQSDTGDWKIAIIAVE